VRGGGVPAGEHDLGEAGGAGGGQGGSEALLDDPDRGLEGGHVRVRDLWGLGFSVGWVRFRFDVSARVSLYRE